MALCPAVAGWNASRSGSVRNLIRLAAWRLLRSALALCQICEHGESGGCPSLLPHLDGEEPVAVVSCCCWEPHGAIAWMKALGLSCGISMRALETRHEMR